MTAETTMDLLLTRRSVVANKLGPPGPEPAALERILTAAARVPDHKKLAPWRFIVFTGTARETFSRLLAGICVVDKQDRLSVMRLETEATRLARAPVVVAVVASFRDKPGVPEWEQTLSTGAACQNLVIAANASGFATQWITEWYSYNDDVRALLGLGPDEYIAGFIYIGTATEPPEERSRPALSEIVHHWQLGDLQNDDPRPE